MTKAQLSAPFPWFGGKRKVAAEVWARFRAVDNYVEPFFGSGAVLLGRPHIAGLETINDKDGYVANFWRAIQQAPEETAYWADAPVNENDLHAKHIWLVTQAEDLRASLEGDPHWCDPRIAGYWVWGVSSWIGSGFCSGRGPWTLNEDRQLVYLGDNGRGVNRQLVYLGTNGQGVNRKLVHLGGGRGVNRKLVHLGDNGRGVNRKLVHLGTNGQGERLAGWFSALADRLRHVRVCSGDWTRVCGPSVTTKHGMTAVFLDPPYGNGLGDDLYTHGGKDLGTSVRDWAVYHGDDPAMRIALCGYEGEHQMPDTWRVHAWNAGEGFGGQAEERSLNGRRERVWFSPACDGAEQPELFDAPPTVHP